MSLDFSEGAGSELHRLRPAAVNGPYDSSLRSAHERDQAFDRP
jgi:hypothetical protein